jgi:hypothetical protein
MKETIVALKHVSVWKRTAFVFSFVMVLVGYVFLTMVLYWKLFDNAPPVRSVYQHDKFVSRPVQSKEEAKQWEITEAKAGSVVYRYTEYCLLRPVTGEIKRYWENGLVYLAPTTFNIGRVGCYKRSFSLTVPPAAGHISTFYQIIEYQINPIKTYLHRSRPIKLNIL